MPKVQVKTLNKAIRRLIVKADEEELIVTDSLDEEIRHKADRVGFVKGKHKLRLIAAGQFAGFEIVNVKTRKDLKKTRKSKVKRKDVTTGKDDTTGKDVEKRTLVNFKLPPALVKMLSKRAEKEGTTKTAIVELSLREYLKGED